MIVSFRRRVPSVGAGQNIIEFPSANPSLLLKRHGQYAVISLFQPFIVFNGSKGTLEPPSGGTVPFSPLLLINVGRLGVRG